MFYLLVRFGLNFGCFMLRTEQEIGFIDGLVVTLV